LHDINYPTYDKASGTEFDCQLQRGTLQNFILGDKKGTAWVRFLTPSYFGKPKEELLEIARVSIYGLFPSSNQ